MRERGVKISGWQRFWDSIRLPPPVPGDAARRPGTQISAMRRFWDAIKPPPKAGPSKRSSGVTEADQRRRRLVLRIAAGLVIAGALGGGAYYDIASAETRAKAALAEGMHLAAVGNYQDAAKCFSRAAGIDSRMADAYLQRGYARQNLGQQDAALSDFEQALSIDPALAPAHTAIGSIYRDRGDLNRALPEFTAGINAGASVDALYQRGRMYESLGQHQKALEDYNAAILQLTDAPYAYRARASVRENLGDAGGAKEDRQKAFDIEHPALKSPPEPAQ